MTSELSYQDSRVYDATSTQVFDALLAPVDPGAQTKQGTLLAVDAIAGRPGNVGFVQQARYHHGAFDLVVIETLMGIARPDSLWIRQQPDCLMRHNPHERTVPFLDSMVEDLDLAFVDQFGENPAATDLRFNLTPDGGSTRANVTLLQDSPPKVGWFAHRRWQKIAKNNVSEILARIKSRL